MTANRAIEADRISAAPGSDPWADLHRALDEAPAAEREDRINAWVDEFQPVTPSEKYFVRHAATLSWKLDHVERFVAVADSTRVKDAIAASTGESDEQTARAAALASFDLSNSGERIRRYQLALHREVRKDLETFAKLQLQRLKREQETPAVTREIAPVEAIATIVPVEVKPVTVPEPVQLVAPIARIEPVSASKPSVAPQPSRDQKPKRPDPARLLKELRTGKRAPRPLATGRRMSPADLERELRRATRSLDSISMLGPGG